MVLTHALFVTFVSLFVLHLQFGLRPEIRWKNWSKYEINLNKCIRDDTESPRSLPDAAA